MQAQLWSLSGLAVELARDRRSLARDLEDLPPDEETTDGAGRVTRRWKMARVVAHLAGVEGLDGPQERARKDKEHADKLALENATRRGELLEADTVFFEYGKLVQACRSRLIEIPDALGQFCDPRYGTVIADEARRRIYEALDELAAELGGATTSPPKTDS